MSLMAVSSPRFGDSLPAELRVTRWRNTPFHSRMRLAAGQAGLTGMYGLNGFGDPCDPTADDYDPVACEEESGVSTTSTVYSPPPCLLSGDAGPLQPGQVYCETGTTIPASGTTAGGALPLPASQIPGYNSSIPGYSGPTVLSPTSTTPAAPTGYEWATIANAAGQTLAKVLAISQGGSAVTLPNGMQLLYGSATAAAGAGAVLTSTTAAFGNFMPLIIGGAALLLLFSMMGNRGGGR